MYFFSMEFLQEEHEDMEYNSCDSEVWFDYGVVISFLLPCIFILHVHVYGLKDT